MIFENVIQYDKAAAQALVEVSSRTLRRKPFLLRRTLLLTVGILAAACGVLLLMDFGGISSFARVICLLDLAVGLLALRMGIFLRRTLARRLMRTMTGGQRRVLFTEEEIQVEQPGVQRVSFYYPTLTALYETEAYFVLPLSTGVGIVLDKGGFVQGSVAEFRKFIQEKAGKAVAFIGG